MKRYTLFHARAGKNIRIQVEDLVEIIMHVVFFFLMSMGAKDILYIYTIRLHWSRTSVLTFCPDGHKTIIMRFFYFKNINGSIEDFQKLNSFLLYDHIVYHVPRA